MQLMNGLSPGRHAERKLSKEEKKAEAERKKAERDAKKAAKKGRGRDEKDRRERDEKESRERDEKESRGGDSAQVWVFFCNKLFLGKQGSGGIPTLHNEP